MRSFMAARRGRVRRVGQRAFLLPESKQQLRANEELSTRNLVLALSVGIPGCVHGKDVESYGVLFALKSVLLAG